MGTYISLSVKNKTGNKRNILTQKGGIGTAILCFDESSIHYEKGKEFYFEIEPIEAVRNLEKIIYEINEERYERYDEWTEKALNKVSTTCIELANTLMMCDDDETVFCDMGEYLSVLDDKFKPEEELFSQREFINRLLQGSYEGKFASQKEYETINKLIADFKAILISDEFIESVYNFGTSYDPYLIKIGPSRMFKFKMDIQIKEEYLDEHNNFENFYHRFYRTFENLEIGVEQSFETQIKNGFRAMFYTLV